MTVNSELIPPTHINYIHRLIRPGKIIMAINEKPPETAPVAPVAPATSAPAAVVVPVQAATPETAAPKALATKKAARPAPAKLPARKAPSEKVVVKKVAEKKALLQKTAPKKVLSKTLAAKVETTPLLATSKKPKLVRDSFTIPKAEYVVLDELKQRGAALAHPVKKSELLRAGIKILDTLSDAAFLKALAQVPAVKTGRPAHKK
ncbi:MAG: hypothetical protein ABIO73_17955 [Polaromonas sp.]